MEIIKLNINELKPYANNPRFNDDAVEYVKKSIQEFGFKVPLVIDKNKEIITGHTRYKASIELGLKEIPCIIADDLTEEQIKAFRLADNKVSEISTWNFELLDEELEEIELNMEDFGFEVSEIDWDSIEELDNNSYQEPEHKMLECPSCHHIDRDIHFKKVGVADE